MKFLSKILEILDANMTKPTLFGWFHLLFLALTVGAAILLCRLHDPEKPERVRRVVFVTSVIVMLLEIYKQINYSFSYAGGVVDFDFQWYAFPFQFCSTPMYIGLLVGLFKKGKVHDALCSYLATYAMFAGLCVMIYPGDVFVRTIGINIQTMMCHGSMITVGIYLLYSGYVKLQHKTILKAMAVFVCMLAIAAGLNELAHLTGFTGGETFNMFYFSPYEEPSLPVYSVVQNMLRASNMPHIFEFLVYVLVFSLAAYIMLLIGMLVRSISRIGKKAFANK